VWKWKVRVVWEELDIYADADYATGQAVPAEKSITQMLFVHPICHAFVLQIFNVPCISVSIDTYNVESIYILI
jgi:hypothetical protein